MIYNLLLITLSLSGPIIYAMEEEDHRRWKWNRKLFKLSAHYNDHSLNNDHCRYNDHPLSASQFYDGIHQLFEQGFNLSNNRWDYGGVIESGAITKLYYDGQSRIASSSQADKLLSKHILSLAAYSDVHKMDQKSVLCFLLICKDYQKKMKLIVPKPIKMKIIDEAIRSNAIMASLEEYSQRIELKEDIKNYYFYSSAETLFTKKGVNVLNEKEICDTLEQKYNGRLYKNCDFERDHVYLTRFDFMNLHIDYFKNNEDSEFDHKKLEEKNNLLNPKNWDNSYSISLQKLDEHKKILCLHDEQKPENTLPDKKSTWCIVM